MRPTPLTSLGRRNQLALVAVVAIGAAFRFGAIGAGAPFRIANDEPFVVGTALRIMQTGDFNPHFFHYGGLAIYLHTFVAVCRFLVGAVGGEWSSLSGVWIGDYLTAARIMTAALGTLTVVVVFRIGLRLGTTVAVLGALLMAVLSPHVRESHFALTDIPLTLMVALTLLLSLRAAEQARIPAVVIAAVAAGLAASVKYNGAIALIMPLISALALPAGSRLLGMSLAFVASGAAFVITSPYTVIDLPGFLNGFADLSKSYNLGRSFPEAAMTYVKFLRSWFAWPEVAPLEVGYLGLALAVIGGGLIAIKRGPALSKIGAGILLVFPCVWFVMLSKQGSLQYGRYLLPIAPMLCVGLAAALTAAWTHAARYAAAPRWAIRVPALAMLVLMSGSAFAWVREHAQPHTEELASAWLVREVPAGQTVVVEAAAVSLPHSLKVQAINRLIDRPIDYYRQHNQLFLVTTASETDPYFLKPRANARELAAFQQLVSETDTVATFEPSGETTGPRISILRVRPAVPNGR